jgi:cyclic pyranopterin phosphate synthase
LDELKYLIDIFVKLGINKIRLTGGEPTVFKELKEIIRYIGDYKKEKRDDGE